MYLEQSKEQQKQDILLREYGTCGSIVYIVKVKTLDDGYIVKIGESRNGILERYKSHQTEYDCCVLLDCFTVERSNKFEKFIHHKLSKYRVTDLVGHETERELFKVNRELVYTHILDLIDKYQILQ